MDYFFTGGSLFCYWANSLAQLIAGRVMMGFGASMGQGVGTAIVVSVFPANERGKAIGTNTTAVAIGGALGPVFAGILLQFYPWQSLFLSMAILAGLAILWGLFILDDQKIGSFESKNQTFDWFGASLSTVMIFIFVMTINNTFSSEYLLLVLGTGLPVSMLLLILFIKQQKQSTSQILDLSLISNPVFSYASIIRIFGFMSRSSSMLLLPISLLNIMQLNEGTIGMIMLVTALGMGSGAQSRGRLSDLYGPRRFMINGLIMAFFNQNSSLLMICLLFSLMESRWVSGQLQTKL